jgi:mannose/fructose/N-acetylgalactosamine-specific phosphotransferase system component IIC
VCAWLLAGASVLNDPLAVLFGKIGDVLTVMCSMIHSQFEKKHESSLKKRRFQVFTLCIGLIVWLTIRLRRMHTIALQRYLHSHSLMLLIGLHLPNVVSIQSPAHSAAA